MFNQFTYFAILPLPLPIVYIVNFCNHISDKNIKEKTKEMVKAIGKKLLNNQRLYTPGIRNEYLTQKERKNG